MLTEKYGYDEHKSGWTFRFPCMPFRLDPSSRRRAHKPLGHLASHYFIFNSWLITVTASSPFSISDKMRTLILWLTMQKAYNYSLVYIYCVNEYLKWPISFNWMSDRWHRKRVTNWIQHKRLLKELCHEILCEVQNHLQIEESLKIIVY